MSSLSKMTPAEIDGRISELWQIRYHQQDIAAKEWSYVEMYISHVLDKKTFEKVTQEEIQTFLTNYSEISESTELQEVAYPAYYDRSYAAQAWAHYLLALDAETRAAETSNEIQPFDEEYQRRGRWSRFFLVNNNGGHIHSSMYCSTCFPTTRFGWLPQESGKTEEDAVKAHGAILCTVCFPSAPVEWTMGKVDPDACEGSGKYINRDLPHRVGYYSGNWAECPECHTNQTVTKGLKFRKHKRPA